ncbi:MAG: hypothetical protein K2W96_12905 [Gemmataceae bacterium]|nr:hypothetical protein [Gemmataceae bacterium]
MDEELALLLGDLRLGDEARRAVGELLEEYRRRGVSPSLDLGTVVEETFWEDGSIPARAPWDVLATRISSSRPDAIREAFGDLWETLLRSGDLPVAATAARTTEAGRPALPGGGRRV